MGTINRNGGEEKDPMNTEVPSFVPVDPGEMER